MCRTRYKLARKILCKFYVYSSFFGKHCSFNDDDSSVVDDSIEPGAELDGLRWTKMIHLQVGVVAESDSDSDSDVTVKDRVGIKAV